MKFKGTIIITDPCYIMRAEHHGTTPITDDDWEACDCGQNMEVLGIKHYICERTIYGDWGCTTYKVDGNPKEIIDNFAEAEEMVEIMRQNAQLQGISAQMLAQQQFFFLMKLENIIQTQINGQHLTIGV